jgi:hypothetical protein
MTVISIQGGFVRVDKYGVPRPGNIYHAARSFHGLVADFYTALDYVNFYEAVPVSEVTTAPSYQWALTAAQARFGKSLQ